eukprot:1534250-Amphidinium_carterae.1
MASVTCLLSVRTLLQHQLGVRYIVTIAPAGLETSELLAFSTVSVWLVDGTLHGVVVDRTLWRTLLVDLLNSLWSLVSGGSTVSVRLLSECRQETDKSHKGKKKRISSYFLKNYYSS